MNEKRGQNKGFLLVTKLKLCLEAKQNLLVKEGYSQILKGSGDETGSFCLRSTRGLSPCFVTRFCPSAVRRGVTNRCGTSRVC